MPEKGVKRRVNAKLSRTQLRKPWSAQFVTSLRRANCPGAWQNETGCARCIKFFVDLAEVHTEVRNHHWWNMSERYELARFEIILTPGLANLKVEFSTGNSWLIEKKTRWSST